MISIRKRGNSYQYCFDIGKVNGKRKQMTNVDLELNVKRYLLGKELIMNLLMEK